MLELLIAVVALALGFFAGVWIRKDAVTLYERGVKIGLEQASLHYVKNVQHHQPRHENRDQRRDQPQDKK